jgi:hypothetical protein
MDRVITIRLPAEQHEALKTQAHACQTSLNQFCIYLLQQPFNKSRVPKDKRYENGRPKVPQPKRYNCTACKDSGIMSLREVGRVPRLIRCPYCQPAETAQEFDARIMRESQENLRKIKESQQLKGTA